MKQTGIVRRLDGLGRLCLPIEMRRTLQISEGDSVEYYLDGDKIVIKKYDIAGDLEQILENAERGIRQQKNLMPKTVKALASTTLSDGMYYELTYNGNKRELYVDAYKKWLNFTVVI